MARDVWFKAYAADVLTDDKMDSLPPEAEGLLWRMWCVCCLRGSIPADPEEIARLTCRKLSYVSLNVSFIESFFTLRDGNLYSHRMEREKEKSAKARESVSHRKDIQEKLRSSNRLSNRSSQKSECQSQNKEQELLSDQSSDDLPLSELRRKDDAKIPVRRVFDYYREKIGKSAAYLLNDQRMKQGLARFKDGVVMARAYRPNLPIDELPEAAEKLMRIAVEQMALSDYHMGREGDGTTYNEWDNLFRSQSMFQKWVDKKLGAKPSGLKSIPDGQSFAERNS